eukprot:2492442-Pyramimonas_sp.AAC.1
MDGSPCGRVGAEMRLRRWLIWTSGFRSVSSSKQRVTPHPPRPTAAPACPLLPSSADLGAV